MSRITAAQINAAAVMLGALATGAAETTFVTSTMVDVGGMSITITTTRANQDVMVISQFQTYQGGYSSFQYTLDGSAVGHSGKYNTGVNTATTGMVVFMDWFTIPTAGSHTIKLQASSGGSGATLLRIINSEGVGRMVVTSA